MFTDVNEQNLKAISNQILDLGTNVLMIGWCYANNGDLAMALRSDATLSQLILEQEMRDIGILNPQISNQQKEVLQEAFKKKDVFLYGNTGAGKTVIGAEVVKIKMAQWIRNSVSGTVQILTYHDNKEAMTKLKKYFKNTLFKNVLRCNGIKVVFRSFSDVFGLPLNFLDLSLSSPDLLKSAIDDYCKNITRKQIIMVDEFEMTLLTDIVDGTRLDGHKLDFSDFSQHNNVNFIICVSPISEHHTKQGSSRIIDYYPQKHKYSYIKWLEGRYRNTKKILEFIKMMQCLNQSEKGTSLSIENDKDVLNLPSPFPNYDPPILWIDFDVTLQESCQTVVKRIQSIISSLESQVPVLSGDLGGKPDQITEFENNLITMINTDNKKIIQQYIYHEFIGMEADIVIVPLLAYHDPSQFGSYYFDNEKILQCFSRARRMLIIITSYKHPVMNYMWNKIPILNAAFHSGEKLVQKIHVNGSNESQPIIGGGDQKLDIKFTYNIVANNWRREEKRRRNISKSYYNYYCKEFSSDSSIRDVGSIGTLKTRLNSFMAELENGCK